MSRSDEVLRRYRGLQVEYENLVGAGQRVDGIAIDQLRRSSLQNIANASGVGVALLERWFDGDMQLSDEQADAVDRAIDSTMRSVPPKIL